jgi:hypothetical protein
MFEAHRSLHLATNFDVKNFFTSKTTLSKGRKNLEISKTAELNVNLKEVKKTSCRLVAKFGLYFKNTSPNSSPELSPIEGS